MWIVMTSVGVHFVVVVVIIVDQVLVHHPVLVVLDDEAIDCLRLVPDQAERIFVQRAFERGNDAIEVGHVAIFDLEARKKNNRNHGYQSRRVIQGSSSAHLGILEIGADQLAEID